MGKIISTRQQERQQPQRDTEFYSHLSYRAIKEMEEAEREATEGRGALAWALLALIFIVSCVAWWWIATHVGM